METKLLSTINPKLQWIGEGSFGKVYLYDQRYVIKQTHFASEEYYFMQRLNSRYIPKPYFFTKQLLAMTYIEGESLDVLSKPLNLLERLSLVTTMLYLIFKMQCCHFSHNDIKPANIIKRGYRFYLIDFGSAKKHGSQGPRFGSRRYASKAYLEGTMMDWRTDLYAFYKTYQDVSPHAFLFHFKKSYLILFFIILCLKPMLYGGSILIGQYAFARQLYPQYALGYPFPKQLTTFESYIDDGLFQIHSKKHLMQYFCRLDQFYTKEAYQIQTQFYKHGIYHDLYLAKRKLKQLSYDERLQMVKQMQLESSDLQSLYLYEAFTTNNVEYQKELYPLIEDSENKGILAYTIFSLGVYDEGYLHQASKLVKENRVIKSKIQEALMQWPETA